MPETEPGQAPALLTFANTTSMAMTFWLDQAIYFAIPAGQSVGPDLAATADVKNETTVGEHQEDSGLCVKFRLSKCDGPTSLTPGASYAMSLTFMGRKEGYHAMIREIGGKPFLAVRGEIHDPTFTSQHPSTLGVELADGSVMNVEAYDSARTVYVHTFSQSRTATRVRFVDGAGTHFAGSVPVALTGGAYTAIVGDEPASGASEVTALEGAAE